ncbi:MAG: hypothetical protein ACYCQK_01705 [Acidiferrobacteraceae bacterium]
MTVLSHWYHVYAAGAWEQPVEEHLSALAKSGFDGPITIGLVGLPGQRAEAKDFIEHRRHPDRYVEADTGWEQVTLRDLRAYAKRHRDRLSFYAHTKGAANPSRLNAAWRRSMTTALLADGALESHVASLLIAFDVIGCHWLTDAEYPVVKVPTKMPMFGGNFWMARNDYLATLPPLGMRARHEAESWIGEGPRVPRVLDLNPGWPGTVPWIERIGWAA